MTEPIEALLKCYDIQSKVSREAIGSRLRLTREALGFGMTAFAKKMRIEQDSISEF